MSGQRDLDGRVFAALAVALPVALACVHHDLGHAADIAFFHRWYLAVREGGAFYRDGPGINYPIVGVLLVAGPALGVEALTGRVLDLAAYTLTFKATLILGEILLVLASERLARALGVGAPRTFALVLLALPSSWAGGAWFGQTDVWGTLFLVVAGAAAIAHRRSGSTGALLLALGAIVLAVLAKQLTWFAVPALVALVLVGLRAHPRPAHLALTALSPALLFLADPFLALPDGGRSHLFYVLVHGSDHGRVVVASGASVWSLFFVGGVPSASVRMLGLDAQAWGWIAWSVAALGIAAVVVRDPRDRSFVWAAGVCELAMALLLTGVHERYLAHAIPLTLLASSDRGASAALGLAVACVSGLFVLATITPGLDAFASPIPTALLTIAWAIALAVEARRAFG